MKPQQTQMVEPQWGIDDALLLIRRMQKEVRPLGYHLALGGGVLNKGYSNKDVDIYILPCLGEKHRMFDLLRLMRKEWGNPDLIGTSGGTDDGEGIYSVKHKYTSRLGRIDVFIVRGSNE